MISLAHLGVKRLLENLKRTINLQKFFLILVQNSEPKLATHVLQFIFLSDSGFRFPIAQFPSGSRTATDLFSIFWEGVLKMMECGFNIYWCILDGAEVNRQFIKLHFNGESEAGEKKFTAQNVYTGEPMVFMMDSTV